MNNKEWQLVFITLLSITVLLCFFFFRWQDRRKIKTSLQKKTQKQILFVCVCVCGQNTEQQQQTILNNAAVDLFPNIGLKPAMNNNDDNYILMFYIVCIFAH